MTDAKDTCYVISQVAADVRKPRSAKKIVIIAVSTVVGVVIVLTAILVGMYLYNQELKEVLQYTMNVDSNTKEEVTIDPNENVNKYYVQNADYDMWVIDDFNRDIEVTKVKTKTYTECFVVQLNRTATVEPSKIEAPWNIEVRHNVTKRLYYDMSRTSISDTSFLGKTARDICKGISVYWLFPKCGEEPNQARRQKRESTVGQGYCTHTRSICDERGGNPHYCCVVSSYK